MTTNARDSIKHVLAADSRWSIDLTQQNLPYILYVDDADYQKLIEIGSGVFMFAGDARLIDAWKFAIGLASKFPNAVKWEDMPTTGVAVTGILRATGEVLVEINQSYREDHYSFAGSGARYAFDCWSANSCAEKAVETAKTLDLLTGGLVRYYRLADGSSNLGLDHPLTTLQASFSEKGYVMKLTHQKPQIEKISEAIKTDATLRSVMGDVANGTLSATAPHEHMNRVWTEQEKRQMVSAMERFFPKSS